MSIKNLEEELRAIRLEMDHRCVDLREKEYDLRWELERAIGRQQVRCTECDKRLAIQNLDVIEEFYFEGNVGCSYGTGQNKSRGKHFVCPACHWPNKRNKRFELLVEEYPDAFKSTTEEHE